MFTVTLITFFYYNKCIERLTSCANVAFFLSVGRLPIKFSWIEVKDLRDRRPIPLKFWAQIDWNAFWWTLLPFAKITNPPDTCCISTCWLGSMIIAQVCLGLVAIKGQNDIAFQLLPISISQTQPRKRSAPIFQPDHDGQPDQLYVKEDVMQPSWLAVLHSVANLRERQLFPCKEKYVVSPENCETYFCSGLKEAGHCKWKVNTLAMWEFKWTMCIWATDALWRREETEVLPHSFLFWVFFFLCLRRLTSLIGLTPFFSTTSVWPFYFYLPSSLSSSLSDISSVCAWLSPFSLSASLSLPLSSTFSLPPLSASFHLFLYLSQWELMWPLCAVSSLRGRQSSSAPIRTALSGAVSTTSPQKKRKEKKNPFLHPPTPPTAREVEREGEGKKRANDTKKVRLKEQQREEEEESNTSPSLLHHPSLTVFTPPYLCLGPGGADTVSIPDPARQKESETLSLFLFSSSLNTFSGSSAPSLLNRLSL